MLTLMKSASLRQLLEQTGQILIRLLLIRFRGFYQTVQISASLGASLTVAK